MFPIWKLLITCGERCQEFFACRSILREQEKSRGLEDLTCRIFQDPAAVVPRGRGYRPVPPTRRARNSCMEKAVDRKWRRTRPVPARREAPRIGRRVFVAWPCGRRRPERSGERALLLTLRRPPRPSKRMYGRPRSTPRSPGRDCAAGFPSSPAANLHAGRPSSESPFSEARTCLTRTAK